MVYDRVDDGHMFSYKNYGLPRPRFVITLLEQDFKNTKTSQYKQGQHVVRTLIFLTWKS